MDNYLIDETTEKAYDHQLMKRLLGFARPYWLNLLLAIILILIATVGDLANPYLIKLGIDNYLNANGRIYWAYLPGSEPIDGILIDDWVFVEVRDLEGLEDIEEGETYSFFQK